MKLITSFALDDRSDLTYQSSPFDGLKLHPGKSFRRDIDLSWDVDEIKGLSFEWTSGKVGSSEISIEEVRLKPTYLPRNEQGANTLVFCYEGKPVPSGHSTKMKQC